MSCFWRYDKPRMYSLPTTCTGEEWQKVTRHLRTAVHTYMYTYTVQYVLPLICMSSAVWYPSHACGVTSSNATTWPLGFAQLWPENISHLLYTLLSEYSWTEIDHPASDKRKAVKFAGWLAGWVEVLHQESIIVRPIILVQLISHDCIRLRH